VIHKAPVVALTF